jgi:hypothetical protein
MTQLSDVLLLRHSTDEGETDQILKTGFKPYALTRIFITLLSRDTPDRTTDVSANDIHNKFFTETERHTKSSTEKNDFVTFYCSNLNHFNVFLILINIRQ